MRESVQKLAEALDAFLDEFTPKAAPEEEKTADEPKPLTREDIKKAIMTPLTTR